MLNRIKTKIKTFFCLLTILLFGFVNNAYSQVNAYTYSQSIVGYTPIAIPTTIAFNATWDNQVPVQATIPFTFTYDSVGFTKCFISTNGFITFGTFAPSTTNYVPLSDNTAYNGATSGGVVSVLGTDLTSTTGAIEYATEGTAPNRTFVIQWTNANRKTGSTVEPGDFDFQIRLSETTNIITFSYGNCDTSLSAASIGVQVGLRGQNNDIAQGNVFNRVQGSSQLWGNAGATSQGFANNSTLYTNSGAYPNYGLQYVFSPGPPCVVPSSQPTALVLGATNITSSTFVGNSFTAPSPAPSKYLILRSTTNVAPTSALIINRTIYAVGANVGSSPVYRVVANSNLLNFTQTSLIPNTTYYYWVISYNEKCTGAPFYNMNAPLFGSATTCFQSTVAGAANPVGGNGFTANWSAVSGATGYAIDVATDIGFTTILPGYNNLVLPTGTLLLAVNGLLPATTYYYRVRALGPGCIANSATITVTTSCGYYTIPYLQNFDTTTLGTVPSCYSVLNNNGDVNQWTTKSVNFASASNSIEIDGGTTDMNDWFFMPGLSMTAGVSYRLKFNYNTGGFSGLTSENLRVQFGGIQSVAGMTNSLLVLSGLVNNFYETAQVDFTPTSSGVYYIGFQGFSIANQTYLVVDDISVSLSPSCIEPTNLDVTAITSNSATANWTASSTSPASGYEYYIATSSTPPTSSTTPTGSVGSGITTLNLTSLSSSTYYWIWVRGNCGATDKSIWSIEDSFNTQCSTPIITSTIPVTRCGYGTSTLTAIPTTGSAIRWYDSLTGGTQIGSGNTYTTPNISATSTYYAEARAFGAIDKVGPLNPTVQTGVKSVQNFQGAINFTVNSSTSLQSVDIFPMVSGQSGKLVIRNSSNVTLAAFTFTTSVSGGATLQQITMNYLFVPGSYNLFFDTLPASGLRMNTTNANYPYIASVASIQGNNIDAYYNLGAYNWKFTTECLSTRVAVTATVNTPPAISLSTTSITICEDDISTNVMVFGAGSYNTVVWSPSTGVSGNLVSGFVFNPTVTTTYTLLANQTSGSLCGAITSLTVNVKQAPPAVSILPASPAICINAIQPLFGSTSISTPAVVFNETFNSATNNWVVANTSTSGDTTASQWTLKPSGYNYINGFGWNALFSSNDASQFYLANSDSQSAVAGSVTRTTLTSPTFNLIGFTSANMSFSHYLRSIAFDKFFVQISLDNGGTWTNLQTYTTTQGAPSGFSNVTLSLAAYLGNATIKVRFNYESNWGYCWAVDNVIINGTLNAALTWSPATALYTDPAATIPYVAGSAVSVVYSKPTTSITYTATLTGSNGCVRSTTNTLTVYPQTVTGTVNSSQSICNGGAISNLSLVGSVGNIVRWEYADDPAFSINVTPIVNTSTTLTVPQMGSFTTIRYFRAVTKSGVCNQFFTNVVYVALPSTTWDGTSWSNGTPTSGVRTIFNGNYTSTGNLYTCSVRINSGTIIFNSGHSLIVDNDVTVAGGSLTFNDTASLVQVNNVPNSGNITYKRNTTAMKRYDFTYWSSPVASQTLVGLSPLTLSDKYFKFDPTVANWVTVSSTTTMDIGKGYIIRAPNNFSTTVGSVFNASFTGVPNNGTITTPVVVAASFLNLIGNPYPSALSADLFLSNALNTGIVDATIYLWTHNTPVNANQYSNNDYAVYNYLGGTGTSASVSTGVNNAVPNGKIAAGQSFFIKGLSNGNATFLNSMRIIGNNDQFFKMASTPVSTENTIEKHRIWLDVINDQGGFKQTLIGYATDATLGFDRGYDGLFINIGNPVSLYSLIDASTTVSIQGRPLPFDDSDEVPLGFYANATGIFTINLSDYDGLFTNQDIFLKDKTLNLYYNLKTAPYTFTSNSGTFNDRFVLVYKQSFLSNNQSEFNSNAIVLYKPNENLHIISGTIQMKEVKVFDSRGRLLLDKKNIDAVSTEVYLGTTNQVLLIEITTDDGSKIIKKYVN